MTTQYGTADKVGTWLVDKLLIAPLFFVSRAVDRAIVELGGDD